MRVLLLGGAHERLEDVRSFSSSWSYNLAREMRRRGVSVLRSPLRGRDYPGDWPETDYVVALGNLTLEREHQSVRTVLRQRVDNWSSGEGKVCQLCDHAMNPPPDELHLNLSVRSPRSAERCVEVGWAADESVFVRRQRELHTSDEPIRILVDHADYVRGRGDVTALVGREVRRLAQTTTAQIRMLVDGGVIDWDGSAVPKFERRHMPQTELAAELGATHIFIATHPEGVGLTALEAAVAGCLVLSPRGCLPEDRMVKLRGSFVGSARWNWSKILGAVDPKKSTEFARKWSWTAVTTKILTALGGWP